MSKYFGTFDEALKAANVSDEDWEEFKATAKRQLEAAGISPETQILTEDDLKAVLDYYERCKDDIGVNELESAEYDEDPYGVGGSYVCADNWSWDEEELSWRAFISFLNCMVCDLLYNYVDLSSEKLEEELDAAATLAAIEYVWDNLQ